MITWRGPDIADRLWKTTPRGQIGLNRYGWGRVREETPVFAKAAQEHNKRIVRERLGWEVKSA